MNAVTKTEAQEAVPQDQPMIAHTTVFEAVAACVPEVRTIGKSNRNKFDGYDFASIDKFLALVGPICGRHGLFPFINLTQTELYENQNSKGGKSIWCRFWYEVTLYHSSGQKLPETKVMVAVPMNGAQSSGSAQSYALKQYFRSVLMIPTGDKDDADLIPTEAHKEVREAEQTVTPDQFIKLRDKMETAGADEAKLLAAYRAQSLQQFPSSKFADAMLKLDAKIAANAPKPTAPVEIAPKENADLDADAIPY